jgi:AraC-like DNA-binding protein
MYLLDSRKYWSDPKVPIQFEFRNPQSPFPLHVHDFHEIVIAYSGSAKHLTQDLEREILSGDFVSIKPGQAHGYKNIRNLVLMNILIKPSFFADDRQSLDSIPAFQTMFRQEPEEEASKAPIIHFRLDHGVFSLAKNLIENARTELSARPEGYGAMVTSHITELIVLLIRNYRIKDSVKSGFAHDANVVIDYVKQNYHHPLSMDDLTGLSGMSESHVLRLFKRYLGCPPFQYINRLRLTEAADELTQTDKSITEIALDLGFNDSNYFSRLFRKNLGLSPREYRNKYLLENLLEKAE